MLRPTSRLITFSLCLASTSACSKNKSEYFNTEESSPFQESNPHVPGASSSNSSNGDLLRVAIASASSSLDTVDHANDPAATRECPSATDWTKFDAFASPCVYSWTTDAQELPAPPEWQPCSAFDELPRSACKELKRSRRPKTFYLGANVSKEMQIGFVEPCASDQIVLADIDGPTRFALRRAESAQFPATCQVKLLAVDMGKWLAALGGHDIPKDLNTSGYSAGGAFIGGVFGSAPTVLFAHSSDPFHVATSQGTISPDGWSANGKRRHWSGKPIEKTPRIGLQRLTKGLLVDEHKGFYSAKTTEPEILLEVPKGHTLTGIQIWDKQIVWQEQPMERNHQICTLVAGEIDAQSSLTGPRRIAEIPCTTSKFALGCNTVLISNDSHLSLLSLANGSSRTLRVKGHAAAVDCKEAFVERSGALLRIDLSAFGPAKAPSSPPTNLHIITEKRATKVQTHPAPTSNRP